MQDFFHSVQLNVNNPHFLIMQGRITKVLNMKPPEILSLLEEAAGTRMYEKKKEGALRTLDKKQARLDQIDQARPRAARSQLRGGLGERSHGACARCAWSPKQQGVRSMNCHARPQVLNDDILPSLEQLRKACGQYQEWAGLVSQCERLRNLLVAYDYTECTRWARLARRGGRTHTRAAGGRGPWHRGAALARQPHVCTPRDACGARSQAGGAGADGHHQRRDSAGGHCPAQRRPPGEPLQRGGRSAHTSGGRVASQHAAVCSQGGVHGRACLGGPGGAGAFCCAVACAQGQVQEAESVVRDLEGEKQIQMGGEMRELQKRVDELSME